MVSVGAGESTFFAQTLKGTREAVSFSPARTAALTPSSLHLRGRAWSSFVWGGRVPEDHVNYSEAELAFVHRAEGKDSGWAWAVSAPSRVAVDCLGSLGWLCWLRSSVGMITHFLPPPECSQGSKTRMEMPTDTVMGPSTATHSL